jgi:FkbM family methyltransferase
MGVFEMKQWKGIWFHDDEEHVIEWMGKVNNVVNGRPTYQYNKYQAALNIVKNRKRAIDVGGNMGLWSMNMVNDFANVEAFEPVQKYCEVFVKNAPRANLHRVALGDRADTITMVRVTPNSVGDTRPWVEGDPLESVVQMDAPMVTLDSFEFEDVGLIKIDCEGYELNVLRGGLETIHRNKPVIIVEQKAGHGKTFGYGDTAGVDYLRGLGMRVHTEIAGDYIMVF